MADRARDQSGKPPPEPFERRSVLDAPPATTPASSPLRWLLVIVPLMVAVLASGYLLRSFWERAIVGGLVEPETAAQSSGPQVGAPERRPSDGDRSSSQPSADLSWIFKEAPAPPSAPRAVEQQAEPESWTFNSAEIVSRLARADPQNGSVIFKRCVVCHSAERDAGHRLGPRMWNMVGRQKASYGDFRYSQALRSQVGRWTYADLARYLHDTRAAVPGGSMAFAGIRDPDKLADVIAFMRTLADKPEPLP